MKMNLVSVKLFGQDSSITLTHTHAPLVRSPLYSVFSNIIHKLLLGPSTADATEKKGFKELQIVKE